MGSTRYVSGLLAAIGLCATTYSAFAADVSTTEDAIVVSRGDAQLPMSAIDARVGKIPEDKRSGFMDSPERIEQLLTNMLLIKQFANQGRDAGIASEPQIAAELQLVQDEVLAKHYLNRRMANVVIPDFGDAAYERYLSSPERFTTSERADVRHLIIKRETHGDAGAKALAEKLRAEFVLSADGDFEAFIKQHSEEKGAELNGGLIRGLARGKADGGFENAAFALTEKGELSPVTSSRFGYHIIQLVARQASSRQPFEQVRPAIEATMKSEFLARTKQEFIDEFRAMPLEASPELVQSLRTRYLPADSDLARERRQESAEALPGPAGLTDESADSAE